MDSQFVLKAIDQTLEGESIRMRVTFPENEASSVYYLAALIGQKMITMEPSDISKLREITRSGHFGETGRQFVIKMTGKFDPEFFARTAPAFLEKIEAGKKKVVEE